MTFPLLIEQPKDLTAAARRLAALNGRGAVFGGGLEILEEARNHHSAGISTLPEILIPLRQMPDTSYIEIRSGELRLGAATTIAEIAESVGIKRTAWPLGEAAAAVGSPQIREQATLAGNLLQRPRCWYLRNGFPCVKNGGVECPAVNGDNRYHAVFDGGPSWSVFHSDVALALFALDAKVVVITPTEEKIISISELYTDPRQEPTREHVLKPGEIIREIRIQAMTNRYTGTFMKITERSGFDFSIAAVAVVYNNFHGRFKDMRMFLGGVAPRPYVPQKTIDALLYKKLSRTLIPPAADLAADGAAPLSQNAYKLPIIKNLVRQALEKTYQRLSWKPD